MTMPSFQRSQKCGILSILFFAIFKMDNWMLCAFNPPVSSGRGCYNFHSRKRPNSSEDSETDHLHAVLAKRKLGAGLQANSIWIRIKHNYHWNRWEFYAQYAGCHFIACQL